MLASAFPWCAGWETELRALFAAFVEAMQHQRVLDYDDLLLYWAHMMAEPAIAAFEAMRLPEPVTRMLVENLQRRALPEPVIGVYVKVAHSKGSYDLISALEMLAEEGTAFTLLGAVGGQRRLLLPFLEAVAATRHLRQQFDHQTDFLLDYSNSQGRCIQSST